MIKYLKHTEIDKQKWDQCINKSVNSLPYAFSWFLDIVSPGWDALVEGNYEAVMPLTWRKKWGIRYLYTPPFAQSLGVFKRKTGGKEFYIDDFIDSIPKKFRLIDINLNRWNRLQNHYPTYSRNTYELELNPSYESIIANYSRSNRRNVEKAKANGVKIISSDDIHFFESFYVRFLHNKKILKKEYSEVIQKLFKTAFEKGYGELYFASVESKIVSVLFLLKNFDRIILYTASTDEGRKNSSVFLLIDYIIFKFSQKNIVFDFAGSDIEGIAKRNEGFGSQFFSYLHLKEHRMPFFLEKIYETYSKVRKLYL